MVVNCKDNRRVMRRISAACPYVWHLRNDVSFLASHGDGAGWGRGLGSWRGPGLGDALYGSTANADLTGGL